ncbi:MAG: MOSC domain-containing protein [Rhodothalassiaceae bacterium]
MERLATKVEALLTGQPAPLAGQRKHSAIAKRPVQGRVDITPLGLAGDSQADRNHHGGPDKAVHHYPFDHYAHWRAVTGLALAEPGWFGENISTTGLTEQTVCLGDRFQIGTAVLEVSHGRQPCATLVAHLGRKSMVKEVLSSGFTGWYYRVVTPGQAQAGDPVTLTNRPCPDWPLARLTDTLLHKGGDRQTLADLAEHAVLAEAWRQIARAKLATAA